MGTASASGLMLALHALCFAPLLLAALKPNWTRFGLIVFAVVMLVALGSHFAWSMGLMPY